MDRGAQRLTVGGVALAYRFRPGAGPAVVFLPGYMSDMSGTKAEALDAWATQRGRTLLRLDYSGCGASGGDFADGTIGRWAADAAAVIDAVAPGPAVLVGSSMGAWIALLLARSRPTAAVVTVAGAPDFTDWGLALSAGEVAEIAASAADTPRYHGRINPVTAARPARVTHVTRPSRWGAPYRYHFGLIAEAATHRLLPGPIAVDCPVRLLHGQADADVPWRLSLDVAAALRSRDVQVTLVKDGDHRLSRPGDLALLTATLDALDSGGE